MNSKSYPFISGKGDGTLVCVYVQPKAAVSELAGIFQDRLKIRVNAPPAEGEANRACREFLAEVLDVPKSEVKLVGGAQSRRKNFFIARPVRYVCGRMETLGIAG